MTAFVLDCSVTLPWCFCDETSPYAAAVLRRLEHDEAIVPSLWHLEVANGILVGERRGRITPDDSDEFLARLARLPISTDEETSLRALSDTVALARTHGLSAYDAACLELALRSGLPLATADSRLLGAAAAAGVPVIAHEPPPSPPPED